MPKMTKRTKELLVRVEALEDALRRGLEVHGCCANAALGEAHCSNAVALRQDACYICHMRWALEETNG